MQYTALSTASHYFTDQQVAITCQDMLQWTSKDKEEEGHELKKTFYVINVGLKINFKNRLCKGFMRNDTVF